VYHKATCALNMLRVFAGSTNGCSGRLHDSMAFKRDYDDTMDRFCTLQPLSSVADRPSRRIAGTVTTIAGGQHREHYDK
jgi:alpha-D-ribose 1-methylphosphonate 5-triphosphate synthase subunit PhnI